MTDEDAERKEETSCVAPPRRRDAGLKVSARASCLLAAFVASVIFLNACTYAPPGNSASTGNANAARANANANANTSTSATPAANASLEVLAEPQVDVKQGEPELSAPPIESDASAGQLLVPVSGVRAEDLRDTYTETRSAGRSHDSIDIPAARGTPVLAAADGKIIKLFTSIPGGITVYQLLPDNRTILYYAHLERYADGLHEGQLVRRGDVIAYVGDTGNAGKGNYHLHFSVSVTSDPKKWWSGTNVNPYPLLRK